MEKTEVQAYLDGAICKWRSIRDDKTNKLHGIAPMYIDAYQSARSSIVGESLPTNQEESLDPCGVVELVESHIDEDFSSFLDKYIARSVKTALVHDLQDTLANIPKSIASFGRDIVNKITTIFKGGKKIAEYTKILKGVKHKDLGERLVSSLIYTNLKDDLDKLEQELKSKLQAVKTIDVEPTDYKIISVSLKNAISLIGKLKALRFGTSVSSNINSLIKPFTAVDNNKMDKQWNERQLSDLKVINTFFSMGSDIVRKESSRLKKGTPNYIVKVYMALLFVYEKMTDVSNKLISERSKMIKTESYIAERLVAALLEGKSVDEALEEAIDIIKIAQRVVNSVSGFVKDISDHIKTEIGKFAHKISIWLDSRKMVSLLKQHGPEKFRTAWANAFKIMGSEINNIRDKVFKTKRDKRSAGEMSAMCMVISQKIRNYDWSPGLSGDDTDKIRDIYLNLIPAVVVEIQTYFKKLTPRQQEVYKPAITNILDELAGYQKETKKYIKSVAPRPDVSLARA